MGSSINDLFDAYAAAYARGERPSAEEYLKRAGTDADNLAVLIDRFLQAAPAPQASDDDVELFEGWMAGESPLLRLRVARGRARDAVVDALVSRLGLNRAKQQKVKDYYHQLESGLLDEQRVGSRVFSALAAEIGVRTADLVGWRPRPLGYQEAFLRADPSAPAARLAMPSKDDEGEDEVDRLFLSGG